MGGSNVEGCVLRFSDGDCVKGSGDWSDISGTSVLAGIGCVGGAAYEPSSVLSSGGSQNMMSFIWGLIVHKADRK